MASNFENKTGAALDWQSVIEYLLTTDRVLGDPADIVGAVGGKINVVLQQIIDNLNWLREKGLVDATTTVKGLVELANIAEGRAGSAQNVVPPVNVVRDMISTHAPTPGPSGISESRVNQLINAAIANFRTASQISQAISDALVSATTDRQGIVELATETEAANENENTKALTAASLYRTASYVLNNADINIASNDWPNPENYSVGAINNQLIAKYFGPIQISDFSSGRIDITINAPNPQRIRGQTEFALNIPFDLIGLTWSTQPNGGWGQYFNVYVRNGVVVLRSNSSSGATLTITHGSFTIRGTA